ncbi:hypothetical protein, partial [Streptobacillus felis]|uniref:hypothetical protein n=1 Tax=Streptobacillus felis TaxID=1384509 RepID=UPI000B28623E
MLYQKSLTTTGGLVYCNILHNATYIRDLGNEREVSLKGLPSHVKGEEINITSNIVNLKDEDKKTLREEDERYVNNKENIYIDGKNVEYTVEEDPRYVKLSNFLNNPYFLNNIKYNNNNRYLLENFKMNQNELEHKPSKSNITINAKNLNIRDQKLLFDNINLSSNNILIEGARLKALDNLNIKSDNITLKSIVEDKETYLVTDENVFIRRYEELKKSTIEANNLNILSKNTLILGDIKVNEDINISTKNLEISGDKITNKSHILDNYTDILVKEEKVDNSTINAKNINIKSNETTIKSSNLNIEDSININSTNLLITGEKTKELKEEKSYFNNEYLLDKKEINNSSNIKAQNINLNNTNATVIGSDITSNTLEGKNLKVESQILDNKYVKKIDAFTLYENTNVDYESSSSSNVKVKDIKLDRLDVKGSNLESNKLESKDLNVESEVLNTSLKQKVETFKLVDNVK